VTQPTALPPRTLRATCAHVHAGFCLRDDAVPEILTIDPVGDTFRITTAFHVSLPPPVTWWTDVTMTVYAEREGGEWMLANALVPNTRGWRRDTVGAIKFGATGGLAQPVNRQLFSGIPALGKVYRHELAHLVLAPLMTPSTWYMASEGVATWLGGTTGGSARYATARPRLEVEREPQTFVDLLQQRGRQCPYALGKHVAMHGEDL